MQTEPINQYSISLDESFSKIIRSYNKLQLEDYTSETISKGKELKNKGYNLLSLLKSHINGLETMLSNCSAFVAEIEEDLNCEPKNDDYVYQTKNGMLGYPGKEFIKKIIELKESQKKTATIKPLKEDVQKILIPDIGYHLKVPVVADVKDIPHAFYYCKNLNGLYMRLPNNNIVKIPFPEVVDSRKEYDRKHSIRCKYHSKQECDIQRKKMARSYNSTLRICNFGHDGDKIIKIGFPARCPSVPNFGNPTTMSTDIKNVTEDDVKNLLLYGLSDFISGVVWLDHSGVKDKEFYSLSNC